MEKAEHHSYFIKLLVVIICHMLCVQGQDATSTNIGYVGMTVTIDCPLTGSYIYPGWAGPDDTVITGSGGSTINPAVSARISYAANQRDLILTGVTRADAGTYICSKGIGDPPVLKYGKHTIHVRVLPGLPVILNREIIGGVSSVRGTEGQPLTLTCVCQGGFPPPTLAWYRNTVTSTPVASTPGTDDTSVTVTYTFTPGRSDDNVTYICQSSFTDPQPEPINQTTVQLYLNLKPSTPTVQQVGNATAGSNATLQCDTSRFRPQATITISWKYKGTVRSGSLPTVSDLGNDKYRATSTLELPVQRGDNRGSVECIVTHSTLSSPRSAPIAMNVRFQPVSATVSRNTQTVADGTTPLTLECTVGVGGANPAVSGYSWTGPGVGTAASNTVTLRPTRDQDGAAVTCTAINTIGSTKSPAVFLDLQYHPITNITEGTSVTKTEGDGGLTLHCSTDSKPTSTIIWYHDDKQVPLSQGPNINKLNYDLGKVNRADAGTYTCSAYNNITGSTADREKSVTLAVLFPPLTVGLTGYTPGMVANGANTLTLNCTAGYSRPVSTIVWRKGSSQILAGTPTVIHGSQYGGTQYREKLILTPTRSDDGTVITCSAWNNVTTQSVVKTVQLDLRYSPKVTEWTNTRTVIEGTQDVEFTCTASSKPVATIKWYKDNTEQGTDTGTQAGNSRTYTIGEVSRSHSGQYRCEADNRIPPVDEKSMTLTVQYPPDVTVTGHNGTVNNRSLTITCNANGVPGIYSYHGWNHTWPDDHVIAHQQGLAATKTLTLTNLTYKYSGIYTCRASNALPNSIRTGSMYVIIKSHPVIIDPKIEKNKVHKVTISQLGPPITINITYYSNAGDPNVSFHRVVDNGTQSASVDNVTMVTTETAIIQLPMLDNNTVAASGFRATVNLTIDHESELGFYQVKLRNTIGTTTVDLQIQSKGPPEPPEHPAVSGVSTTSVNVSWNPGFHGGLDQTFVVQYRTDGSTNDKAWADGPTLYTGLNVSRDRHQVSVDSLSPGQLYYLKICAYNEKGRVCTATFNVTTSTKEEPSSSNVAAIAGAAGGCGLALIIIIVVAVFIFWRRRSRSNEKPPKDTSLMLNNRHIDAQEDDDEGIRDNPTYVSADIVHAGPNTAQPQGVGNAGGAAGTGDVYAVVDKPKKPMPLNSDAVYSVVDKSKPVKAGTSKDTSGVDKTLPLDPSAIYSIVDKNTPVKAGGAAGTGDVYAVVDKPKKPMPLDPNAVYSDVEKPVKDSKTKDNNEKKRKGDKKEKKPKEKKADKKTKGGKGKKSSTPTTVAGTVYENATDMYMNAPNVKTGDKENVYENPEVSKPKLAPKPQPTRNKNPDGLIYLDVELTTKKESDGRQLVIHGEEATDYAIVEIGKVGAQYPESDNEGEKEEKK